MWSNVCRNSKNDARRGFRGMSAKGLRWGLATRDGSISESDDMPFKLYQRLNSQTWDYVERAEQRLKKEAGLNLSDDG